MTDEEFLSYQFPQMMNVKIFKPGEAFGEIALITKSKRTATMVCQQDTVVISLQKQAFDQILGSLQEQLVKDQLDFLKMFSFFNGFVNSQLLSMLRSMNIEKYVNNKQIYQEGDSANYFYLIRKGQVSISKLCLIKDEQYEEKQQQVQTLNQRQIINQKQDFQVRLQFIALGPNRYFGEYEFEDNQVIRQTKAVCVSDSAEIFKISKDKLFDFVKTNNGYSQMMQSFQTSIVRQRDYLKKAEKVKIFENNKLRKTQFIIDLQRDLQKQTVLLQDKNLKFKLIKCIDEEDNQELYQPEIKRSLMRTNIERYHANQVKLVKQHQYEKKIKKNNFSQNTLTLLNNKYKNNKDEKGIEKADFFNYYKDSLAVLDAKNNVLEKLKSKTNQIQSKQISQTQILLSQQLQTSNYSQNYIGSISDEFENEVNKRINIIMIQNGWPLYSESRASSSPQQQRILHTKSNSTLTQYTMNTRQSELKCTEKQSQQSLQNKSLSLNKDQKDEIAQFTSQNTDSIIEKQDQSPLIMTKKKLRSILSQSKIFNRTEIQSQQSSTKPKYEKVNKSIVQRIYMLKEKQKLKNSGININQFFENSYHQSQQIIKKSSIIRNNSFNNFVKENQNNNYSSQNSNYNNNNPRNHLDFGINHQSLKQ